MAMNYSGALELCAELGLFVFMTRKLLSVLGIFAMLVAFLPGVLSAASTQDSPSCCLGVMCPMHQMALAHPICDGDPTSHDGVLQSCPAPNAHFTGALPFVRVKPAAVFVEHLSASLAISTPPVAAKVDADVPSLPPRAFPI
jgi:hypothetical protein